MGQLWGVPTHSEARRQRIAAIYNAYNATRPLTMVRREPYWTGYTTWMYNNWHTNHRANIFVAARVAEGVDLCGYILAHLYGALCA